MSQRACGNSDNTLTVLKVEKGAGKKVEGVQILQMENTKYSVSDLHFLNEHVLEYGEKEDIEMKIDKVRNLIETLTTGLVKLNTNDFVAQGVCRGKRINDGGGCYFVEQKNVATFERYVSELESFLGIDYVSYCRGAINRDADGVFTVAAAVRLNVLSRMEDGLAKLKKYKTDRGVQNRYEEVAELMDEVQMYEDMLGVTFDDLKAELTDARLEITSHLSF